MDDRVLQLSPDLLKGRTGTELSYLEELETSTTDIWEDVYPSTVSKDEAPIEANQTHTCQHGMGGPVPLAREDAT